MIHALDTPDSILTFGTPPYSKRCTPPSKSAYATSPTVFCVIVSSANLRASAATRLWFEPLIHAGPRSATAPPAHSRDHALPPTRSRASRTMQDTPAACSDAAACRPDKPAPTITTSVSVSGCAMFVGRRYSLRDEARALLNSSTVCGCGVAGTYSLVTLLLFDQSMHGGYCVSDERNYRLG